MTPDGSNFHSAHQQAKKLASGAEFQAEQIIASKDPAGCYKADFIQALALISEDDVFNIRLKLKQAFQRDFNTKEFDARVKRERSKLTPAIEVEDWERGLLRSDNGAPKACLANGLTALRKHPLWRDVLAFDEFALHTLKRKPAPWDNGNFKPGPWRDNDDREAANWLQHEGIMVNTGTASESAETVAYDAAFHPVREYLKGLKWDREHRVATWLPKYIKTPDTEYERAVGTKWLISAVARVMQPGCKVDHVLVFEGGQGKMKSTSLRALAEPWFIDHLPDLSKPDASASLCGVWIVELGELSALKKTSNIESIKEFLTRQTDRFRPPYGRRTIEVPRQCVFAASTNKDSWSGDETGGRRFWPVRSGKADVKGLKAVRDQLWAEAMHLYAIDKELWWFDTQSEDGDQVIAETARKEQEDRYEGDAWDDIILRWLDSLEKRHPRVDKYDNLLEPPFPPFVSDCTRVSITDILIHAIGKSVDKWSQWDSTRVGRTLKSNGWERSLKREGAGRIWFHLRPKDQPAPKILVLKFPPPEEKLEEKQMDLPGQE